MYFSFISLLISFSLQGVYQGPELMLQSQYTLYSIDDTNFVLTADSLYSYNKELGWSSRKHFFGLKSYDLDELKYKEKIYLLIKGLGKVYKVINDTIFSIDNSFEWKSRYNSSNFTRKGIIHSYGGYGFFDFKNNFVFFDTLTKDWNGLKTNNINFLHTSPLSKYDSIEDVFYTTLGKQNLYNNPLFNTKTIKFDFRTLTWSEVNEINNEISNFYEDLKTDFRILNYPESSFINKNYFVEIDFINDELIVFDIHNNIIENRSKIIYNEVKEEFFVAYKNNSNNTINFTIIDKFNLLGEKFSTYNLHRKNYYTYYAFGVIISILIIIYVAFISRRRSIYDLIKNKKELDSELDEIEKKLKDKLIDIYPKDLTYPEISILLNLNLSYESNIKKTQKTINHLEYKIQKSLKIKSKIFKVSRNEFDKRIKQVRII